jgi:hypothetical protein
MSDQDPDKPQDPAAPSRSVEAARRLSQLLSRPLGTPAPAGEAPEPYVPRPARAAPPAPAPAPPDDTSSAPRPPAPADPEPDLPWFDRPTQPRPVPEPAPAPEPTLSPEPPASATDFAPLLSEALARDPPRETPPEADADLFDHRDPPRHEPAEPTGEARPFDAPARNAADESARHLADESAGAHHAPEPERVPEWAWPSALDRAPDPAAPRAELHAAPEPLAVPAPEPARPPPGEPPPPAPPSATPPLSPDAARTLGNIRRLMLFSNLFMVIAIGAVLAVVGYRIYRTEPAPPPPPAPVAVPAPAPIPNDMTLTLPRGARIVATAIAGERLVLTIQIDGATEIRTFDIKTLQPAGRLSFTTVP